ncbi:MAG: AbrB/MazE/SpoVT family DNA-binding domain-containing protein [Pseudomonadota bacterium]
MVERHMRVFANGRSRAVRIPFDIDLPGDEVVWAQDENGVITIRPAQRMGALKSAIKALRAAPALSDEEVELPLDGLAERVFNDDRLDGAHALGFTKKRADESA